jgi:hypothetical protein
MHAQSPSAASHLAPPMSADEALEKAAALYQASFDTFQAMLPRLAERIVGPGQPAQDALAQGGFVMNHCTVALRLDADKGMVEFFCDVGLPRPHALQECYRRVLEMNLCRTYEGITFGVHPTSARLVATASLPVLMVASEEVALSALQTLTEVVTGLRAERTLNLEV